MAILWNFLLFPTGAWIEYIYLKNVGNVVNVTSITRKEASISFSTLVAVVNNSPCSSKVAFQPRKSWPSVSTSGSVIMPSIQIAFSSTFLLLEDLAYCAELICLVSDIEACLIWKCLLIVFCASLWILVCQQYNVQYLSWQMDTFNGLQRQCLSIRILDYFEIQWHLILKTQVDHIPDFHS